MNTLHSKYCYSFVFMPDLMERVRIELIQMGLVDRLVCLEDTHVSYSLWLSLFLYPSEDNEVMCDFLTELQGTTFLSELDRNWYSKF